MHVDCHRVFPGIPSSLVQGLLWNADGVYRFKNVVVALFDVHIDDVTFSVDKFFIGFMGYVAGAEARLWGASSKQVS